MTQFASIDVLNGDIELSQEDGTDDITLTNTDDQRKISVTTRFKDLEELEIWSDYILEFIKNVKEN